MVVVKKTQRRTRSEQKEQTRQKLIDAAVEIFRKVGYGAATVNMIADRANASRPTFYAHFKDKRDIAFRMSERIIAVMESAYNELDAIANPTREEVLAWMLRLEALMSKHRTILEAASSSLVVDVAEAKRYVHELKRHSERCMPRHLAMLEGEEREVFLNKYLMLRILQERLLFVTMVRGVDFPQQYYHRPIELLADMWWTELFRDRSFCEPNLQLAK